MFGRKAGPSLPPSDLQGNRCVDHAGARLAFEGEAQFGADPPHAFVFGQDFGDHIFQPFIAADVEQPAQQFRAEPGALVLIADEQGKLGVIGADAACQAGPWR